MGSGLQGRRAVLADLGGLDAVPAARRALLDAATGSMIILTSLDRYVFQLASTDGLVNRRSRRVFAIVEQRQRVADSLARQLQALGLERRERPAISLHEYLAQRETGDSRGGADSGEDSNGALR